MVGVEKPHMNSQNDLMGISSQISWTIYIEDQSSQKGKEVV